MPLSRRAHLSYESRVVATAEGYGLHVPSIVHLPGKNVASDKKLDRTHLTRGHGDSIELLASTRPESRCGERVIQTVPRRVQHGELLACRRHRGREVEMTVGTVHDLPRQGCSRRWRRTYAMDISYQNCSRIHGL